MDPAGHVDHLVRIVHRRAQKTALMWAVIGEVAFILCQDRTQVPRTVDHQVIEAVAA